MMCSKRNRVLLVLAFILSIALFQNANATELILQPDGATGKDTQVYTIQPDTNRGSDSHLTLNFHEVNHGLIEFDASTVPAGAVITSATLEILEEGNCQHNMNAIEIHLNSAAWEESTATWNNAPAYGSSIGTNSGETSGCNWLVFDTSSVVQDWVDGSPNYGFRMTGPTGSNVVKTTLSSDFPTAAERPILRINYEGGLTPATPVPTLSIWGLGILVTLFGFLGFGRRRLM